MLMPRLINCADCSDITILIADIDCKLAELGSNLYNNIVFMLNKPIPAGAILDLLNYKRILQYKYFNPDYAIHFTIEMIASRVNLLKYR
jgi:hypothetical protein